MGTGFRHFGWAFSALIGFGSSVLFREDALRGFVNSDPRLPLDWVGL